MHSEIGKDALPTERELQICKCKSAIFSSAAFPACTRSSLDTNPHILSWLAMVVSVGAAQVASVGSYADFLNLLCKACIATQLEGRILSQKGKDVPGVEQLPSDGFLLDGGRSEMRSISTDLPERVVSSSGFF